MFENKSTAGLMLDGRPEEIQAAQALMKQYLDLTQLDVDDRTKAYKKRRDFFEGKHHLYSNVAGLTAKESPGHILQVLNYIHRMCTRVVQAMNSKPFRFKVKPDDESSELESIRAEMEENWYMKILKDNKFFSYLFHRNCTIQVRDADFAIKCFVVQDEREGKKIKIEHAENMEKLYVIWDDSTGMEFSGVIYKDKWTLEKISREFNGYKAQAIPDDKAGNNPNNDHTDAYGVNTGSSVSAKQAPTGANKMPKAWVTDGWVWFRLTDPLTGQPVWKMTNITMINDEVVQFVPTDYAYNPWMIGHSFDNPGSPWSMSFEDDLIDPQIELNDRSSEEGDMIRIGAHQKYVVVNMPNFDAKSVKPGSGQVIYIEGERADFKPLEVNVNPFPAETYIQRTLKHMFALGIPEIALATGSAPYTGKVGAIQYQPVSDLIDELRGGWAPLLYDLFKRMHDYTVKFFPETKDFMQGWSDEANESYDTQREIELEWDSVLPQSESEDVVNGATLFDRGILPVKRMLERAGYQDPMAIIKELKREAKDADLSTVRQQFRQFSEGVVKASIDAQRAQQESEEANGNMMNAITEAVKLQPGNGATQPAMKPMLQKSQNEPGRGVPAGAGLSGVGQTASPEGALKQTSQNLRAGGI